MRQVLLFFFFLLGFTHAAIAQHGNVLGKINLEDMRPVVGASILIRNLNLQVNSDDKGNYLFKNVPYGVYTMEIKSMEIIDQSLEIAVKVPQNVVNVSARGREINTLNEVSVVGRTEKKKIETSGFAVAVVETKEASLRNLTTNELLDRTVGVRVRQNGGIGASIEYNLNGISGSAVGIFIDGTPIATFGQSFNLNNIPPAMIDRIEVYKGVLPSHLTGDYVGGAINVIMKKDASANSITAATSYGSFNTFQSDLGLLYRNQKTGLTARAFGAYTYTDNSYEMWGKFAKITGSDLKVKRYQRFTRFNNTYRSVLGRFELGYTDVKWADNFFLGYNASDTYRDIPHGTTMAQPYVGRFEEYEAHVFSLNYTKRNFLIEGLALNVNAVHSNRSTYLQDTSRIMYNWNGKPMTSIQNGLERPIIKPIGQGQQGAAVISEINRNIVNVRSNISYSLASNHKISVNHTLNRTNRDDNDLLDLRKKDLATVSVLTNQILAFNYESQIFSNRLRTNLIAKYTYNQNNQSRVSIQSANGVSSIVYTETTSVNKNPGYGATLAYQVAPKLFVIGSTENMALSPQEEQLYGNPERNLLENLTLKAERNENYNLNLRYGIVELNNHKVSIYGGVFWRNGFDKITTQAVDSIIPGRESDADLQTTRFINLGRTQSKGFEGEITYVYKNKLNVLVNFSKFNALFKSEFDDQGRPNAFYNQQLPNEPFLTANASVQYR
ncbi:MAG: TonB-dependent receptor, partial [Bacteroidia bacterium]